MVTGSTEGVGMNRTKIEWATHVHNIMTGCLHGCPYCYARKTAENPFYRRAFPYGFEPHFYEERLNEVRKLRKPAIIFMDSMSDLFGSWWTDEQILKVLHIMDWMRGVHWHKYVVLTKNPVRMLEILERYAKTDGANRLKNVYFGTSVTGLGDEKEIARIAYLWGVHALGYKTVLSIEPLLYDPTTLLRTGSDGIVWIDWIIIGGQTKPTKYPKTEWISSALNARKNLRQPAYLKENCQPPGDQIFMGFKDFPEDLLPIAQEWGKA